MWRRSPSLLPYVVGGGVVLLGVPLLCLLLAVLLALLGFLFLVLLLVPFRRLRLRRDALRLGAIFSQIPFFLSFPSLLFLLPSFLHLTLAKCAHR